MSQACGPDAELLNAYHRKFLIRLAKSDVAFLIIGGQAKFLLNAEHETSDLDIWVRLEAEDVSRLDRVLRSWLREHPQHNIFINTDAPLPLRPKLQIEIPTADGVAFPDLDGSIGIVGINDGIDVLTSLEGHDFDDCFSRAEKHQSDGIQFFSLCAADLIATAKR